MRTPSFLSCLLLGAALSAPGARAATLAIEGCDHLPRKKIDAAISLPDKPSEISAEDWEDWVDVAAVSLTDLYGEIGYLDAAVKVERTDKGAAEERVTIHVREGEKYRFGAVAVV